jgi:2-hydroxyacyl-CoA lyase
LAEVNGATIIARSLKDQGVDYMFGVIGFPVASIAGAAQREGIKFLGFRNEQSAGYAAAIVGYMTGRPGCLLTVSGPGMVHGIAGLSNAWANNWPMILLGGASDTYQDGMGAFEEAPQVEAARPFTKYAARPDSTKRLPYFIEQAVRTSIYGRPGPVYIDLPNDVIEGTVEESELEFKDRCADPPRTLSPQESVTAAIGALKSASNPLVIVGKGAAYSRAEDEVRDFIEKTQLPFIASPMGKGVIPDDHELCVQPARSLALKEADLVFLMGARLNWIMHFGLPPRFNKDVRVVQMDISAEEISTNVPAEVALVGDAKAITAQLNAELEANPWSYPQETTWWNKLNEKSEANRLAIEPMYNDDSEPMNYYRVLREVRDSMPKNCMISSEGANTMDIGRTVLENYEPRRRLDGGSFGTMGVGLGQAIAAAVVHPDKKVVAVEGDSAFGFSGMEVETACRYNLPITFVIINNNGIGGGPSEVDPTRPMPPGAYTPNAHYEKVIEGFGGKGYFVDKVADLRSTLDEAMAEKVPTIVNIMINPRAGRKPQEFGWHTN